MSRIIDYSYLLQKTFGVSNVMSSIPLSSLSSRSVQAQLKMAGINTGSNQYKAAIGSMLGAAKGGMMYTNIQAIKNQMSQYDADGDYIDPTTGLAGLLVTDANRASKDRIIPISEGSRDEMFELTKKEFLRENGVQNGDTTKRSDVYTNLYKRTPKKDRLAAGHTLSQYERQYRQALIAAVKKADSSWEIGNPIPADALDGITREAVEKQMNQTGTGLVKSAFDVRI